MPDLKIKGYTNDVKVTPDRHVCRSSDETGDLQLCNAAIALSRPFYRRAKTRSGLSLSRRRQTFIAAAGGNDTRLTRPGVVKVWNLPTAARRRRWMWFLRSARRITFSPDATTLYVADVNDRVDQCLICRTASLAGSSASTDGL